MKIINIQTYGLAESLIRAGYPMSTLINEDMHSAVKQYGITDTMLKRGIKLGNANGGSGHDNFLKGIIVQADFHAPQYWWQQSQRYHWFDIISSQSKMHQILEMNLESVFPETVTEEQLRHCQGKQWDINNDCNQKVLIEELLDNIPMGFEYTAGVSTNYLQLKTMYHQRRGHRLIMWNKVFVEFCEGLPYFNKLCLGAKND